VKRAPSGRLEPREVAGDSEAVTSEPRAMKCSMPRMPSSDLSIVATSVLLVPFLAVGACTSPPDTATRLPDGSDRGSQPAEVTQRMGSTELRVVYNRPSARGRELFGGLVPHDSIWNPGADEATRIHVSRDVLIDGQSLPAGSYSVWAIPRPDRWTLIFSRAWDVFHVPYPEGEDALRLDVPPASGPHMESLSFAFPMATADSARLELRWGDTVVPVSVRPRPR